MNQACGVFVFCCLLFGAPLQAAAQEQLDLSSPVVREDISSYRVGAICYDWQGARIDIRLFDPVTGETATQNPVTGEPFSYRGQTALDLMIAVNKLNFSTASMHKRIIDRLVADGKISGTVSGTPE